MNIIVASRLSAHIERWHYGSWAVGLTKAWR
jgi:hypothetical protein